MELDTTERNIFGFFSSCCKAKRAADELQEADLVPGKGYLQVDSISRHAVVDDSNYKNSLNHAVTLHGQTHYSNNGRFDQYLNPLLASSDSERGWGVDDDSMGRAFLVTLVTYNNNAEQAVQIMKDNGGLV